LPSPSNQEWWKSICNNLAVSKLIFYPKIPATHLDMVKDKIINKPNKLFEFSDDKQGLDLLVELGLLTSFPKVIRPARQRCKP